jgi:hypothetical protein
MTRRNPDHTDVGNGDAPGPPPWEGVEEPPHIPPIRALFAERLAGFGGAARQIVERWRSGDAPTGEEVAELYRMCHQIQGSAEPLGGVELGGAAAAFTGIFSGRPSAEEPPTPEQRQPLAEAADQLVREIARYERWVRGSASSDGDGTD